mmetsp:Transcript_13952/g.38117  ORF Transcript_13952/g.38117 Transcript_13952/m.38117 type:complete len:206 (+) Transcript_13952:1792-2409(+)
MASTAANSKHPKRVSNWTRTCSPISCTVVPGFSVRGVHHVPSGGLTKLPFARRPTRQRHAALYGVSTRSTSEPLPMLLPRKPVLVAPVHEAVETGLLCPPSDETPPSSVRPLPESGRTFGRAGRGVWHAPVTGRGLSERGWSPEGEGRRSPAVLQLTTLTLPGRPSISRPCEWPEAQVFSACTTGGAKLGSATEACGTSISTVSC